MFQDQNPLAQLFVFSPAHGSHIRLLGINRASSLFHHAKNLPASAFAYITDLSLKTLWVDARALPDSARLKALLAEPLPMPRKPRQRRAKAFPDAVSHAGAMGLPTSATQAFPWAESFPAGQPNARLTGWREAAAAAATTA